MLNVLKSWHIEIQRWEEISHLGKCEDYSNNSVVFLWHRKVCFFREWREEGRGMAGMRWEVIALWILLQKEVVPININNGIIYNYISKNI